MHRRLFTDGHGRAATTDESRTSSRGPVPGLTFAAELSVHALCPPAARRGFPGRGGGEGRVR